MTIPPVLSGGMQSFTNYFYMPYSAQDLATLYWPPTPMAPPNRLPLKQPKPRFGATSPRYWIICDEASRASKSHISRPTARTATRRNSTLGQPPPSWSLPMPAFSQSASSRTFGTSIKISEVSVGQPRCFFLPNTGPAGASSAQLHWTSSDARSCGKYSTSAKAIDLSLRQRDSHLASSVGETAMTLPVRFVQRNTSVFCHIHLILRAPLHQAREAG